MAPHPAEVRGSWGRKGDRGALSPWRRNGVHGEEDDTKIFKKETEDRKRRNEAKGRGESKK